MFLNRKKKVSTRFLSALTALFFMFSAVAPQASAQFTLSAVEGLPIPGTMISVTESYQPAIVRGIGIHSDNPLRFDFYLDEGQSGLQAETLNQETVKLVKYFLAALTVPEKELWVNLSPNEPDRVIPKNFGDTEMGRDLLAQDYILKQLTASLMYPEKELGKKFWERVYAKIYEEFKTYPDALGGRDSDLSEALNVGAETFNKVWITPEKAVVYEHGAQAFVVESHLKVMLEEDYLAQKTENREQKTENSHLTSEMVRRIILPAIEKEVNEGETFANLRQIYNSVILAVWYKKKLKSSLLAKVYADKSKTEGIDTEDKTVNQKIYQQYLDAFKAGVYNYIKEEYDPQTKTLTPRKYFSGGNTLTTTTETLAVKTKASPRDLALVGSSDKKYVVDLLEAGQDKERPLDNAMTSDEGVKNAVNKEALKAKIKKILAEENLYPRLADRRVTEYLKKKFKISRDELLEVLTEIVFEKKEQTTSTPYKDLFFGKRGWIVLAKAFLKAEDEVLKESGPVNLHATTDMFLKIIENARGKSICADHYKERIKKALLASGRVALVDIDGARYEKAFVYYEKNKGKLILFGTSASLIGNFKRILRGYDAINGLLNDFAEFILKDARGAWSQDNKELSGVIKKKLGKTDRLVFEISNMKKGTIDSFEKALYLTAGRLLKPKTANTKKPAEVIFKTASNRAAYFTASQKAMLEFVLQTAFLYPGHAKRFFDYDPEIPASYKLAEEGASKMRELFKAKPQMFRSGRIPKEIVAEKFGPRCVYTFIDEEKSRDYITDVLRGEKDVHIHEAFFSNGYSASFFDLEELPVVPQLDVFSYTGGDESKYVNVVIRMPDNLSREYIEALIEKEIRNFISAGRGPEIPEAIKKFFMDIRESRVSVGRMLGISEKKAEAYKETVLSVLESLWKKYNFFLREAELAIYGDDTFLIQSPEDNFAEKPVKPRNFPEAVLMLVRQAQAMRNSLIFRVIEGHRPVIKRYFQERENQIFISLSSGRESSEKFYYMAQVDKDWFFSAVLEIVQKYPELADEFFEGREENDEAMTAEKFEQPKGKTAVIFENILKKDVWNELKQLDKDRKNGKLARFGFGKDSFKRIYARKRFGYRVFLDWHPDLPESEVTKVLRKYPDNQGFDISLYKEPWEGGAQHIVLTPSSSPIMPREESVQDFMREVRVVRYKPNGVTYIHLDILSYSFFDKLDTEKDIYDIEEIADYIFGRSGVPVKPLVKKGAIQIGKKTFIVRSRNFIPGLEEALYKKLEKRKNRSDLIGRLYPAEYNADGMTEKVFLVHKPEDGYYYAVSLLLTSDETERKPVYDIMVMKSPDPAKGKETLLDREHYKGHMRLFLSYEGDVVAERIDIKPSAKKESPWLEDFLKNLLHQNKTWGPQVKESAPVDDVLEPPGISDAPAEEEDNDIARVPRLEFRKNAPDKAMTVRSRNLPMELDEHSGLPERVFLKYSPEGEESVDVVTLRLSSNNNHREPSYTILVYKGADIKTSKKDLNAWSVSEGLVELSLNDEFKLEEFFMNFFGEREKNSLLKSALEEWFKESVGLDWRKENKRVFLKRKEVKASSDVKTAEKKPVLVKKKNIIPSTPAAPEYIIFSYSKNKEIILHKNLSIVETQPTYSIMVQEKGKPLPVVYNGNNLGFVGLNFSDNFILEGVNNLKLFFHKTESYPRLTSILRAQLRNKLGKFIPEASLSERDLAMTAESETLFAKVSKTGLSETLKLFTNDEKLQEFKLGLRALEDSKKHPLRRLYIRQADGQRTGFNWRPSPGWLWLDKNTENALKGYSDQELFDISIYKGSGKNSGYDLVVMPSDVYGRGEIESVLDFMRDIRARIYEFQGEQYLNLDILPQDLPSQKSSLLTDTDKLAEYIQAVSSVPVKGQERHRIEIGEEMLNIRKANFASSLENALREKINDQAIIGEEGKFTKGGVDLNPALMNMQIKRDENGAPLPLNLQPLENINIRGFVPVIIDVVPVHDLPTTLGMKAEEDDPEDGQNNTPVARLDAADKNNFLS